MMRKIIGWSAIGIGILLLVGTVGGYFLLRSAAFHRYLITKIEQTANESTGGRVEIGKLDIHPGKLSADVYGIEVHGTEPAGSQPLLAADKFSLTLKIVSLLQKKVDLSEIVLEHPVLHLISYPDGSTNIPRPDTPKKEGKPVNVFDLGIKHVLLANGEIYFNQQKTPLNAELHQVRAEVSYNLVADRYDGSLSYRDGRLQMAKAQPLPHDLDATFTATPSRFSLNPAVLRVAASSVKLQANLNDFSNPRLDGSYQILLHTPDFQSLAQGSPLPAGDVSLSGSLSYATQPGVPFLRGVLLDGRLDSRELAIVNPQVRTAIRSLHVSYKLANGDLVAKDLRADLLGGRLIGEASMRHLDTTPVSRVKASLKGVSLAAVRQDSRDAQLKQLPLIGRVNGAADASWTGTLKTLKVLSDVTLKGAIEQGAGPNPVLVPLDGAIHLRYDGASNLLAVKDSSLRTPKTLVAVNGTVSDRSDLRVQARAGDLTELQSLLAAFQTPSAPGNSATPPKKLNIAGSATVDAHVQGSMADPRITAQVNGQNLAVQGGRFSALQFGLEASPSGVSIQNGSLAAMPRGQVNFAAAVALTRWKYSPASPLTANVSVRQMAIRQLQQLANVDYPVLGNVSADLYLKGSQQNPVGNGSVVVTQARVYEQTVQNLSLNFKAAGGVVNSTLSLKTPAGNASGDLSFNPATKAYQAKLDAPGINLASLDVVQQKNVPLHGTLKLTASGKGSVDDPQLNATVEIPQLQVRQASLQGIKAQLDVAGHKANLTLDSQLLQSFVQARGTVDLTGDYNTVASLDTKGLPLAPLIALYKPVPSQFEGLLEFHATAKGPLKNKERMEAHLVVPTFRASYNQIQIANAGPIKIDYANSVVNIAPSEIKGTDSDLRFEGRIPLQGDAPPTMTAKGVVNLELARILSPDINSSGSVHLDVRAVGRDTKTLGVEGQVRLQDVAFSTLSAPVGVEKLNGVLDIRDNQVHITQLRGQSGGGEISAGGVVTYKPQLQMNVALNSKGVRLRYPEGMRTVLDSDLTLTGDANASALNGRVLIETLGFTPDFDLAEFMGQFGGAPSAPPSPDSFASHLRLNIAVQSTSQLSLVSSEVSLQGDANLRVIGTGADPVIVGRANFSGGDLFFRNQRYALQRGIVDFINPNKTEPVVNMVITTVVSQYNLTLTFLGPVDKLRTSYTSDPPLPPVDVINLLARGQTTEEPSPGNLDANSVIASGLASQVSSRLQKFAGLSSLQIDPTLGGNGSNPGARVALQQRVTKNFLFTFSTDVTNPESQVVQGEYQVSKHWALSASRDQYGGYTVDGKFRKTF